ncbi:MAG: 4Fe-4S dicluster domain-containing protein [Paracoccaceae bacterium]
MNHLTTRGAFLRTPVPRDQTGAIKPSGAMDVCSGILCTQSGDRLSTCPENIITVDADSFPVIEVSVGACTFSDDCTGCCISASPVVERLLDWPRHATVEPAAYLSLRSVSRRNCQDGCDHGAIRYKPQLGGRAEPILDLVTCTGCGACAAACPAGAVQLQRRTHHGSKEAQ